MLCGFKMTPAKLFSAFKFHFVFGLKVELQNVIVLSLSALEKYLRCQWEAWFEWKGSRSNMQGLAMEPVSGRPGKRKNDWKGARLPLENLVDQGQCMSLVHSRVFSINRQRHSAAWTYISKRGPASPTSSVASLNTLRRPIVHGKILPRKRLQFSNYVSLVLAVITGQQRLKDAIAVFTRTFTR